MNGSIFPRCILGPDHDIDAGFHHNPGRSLLLLWGYSLFLTISGIDLAISCLFFCLEREAMQESADDGLVV